MKVGIDSVSFYVPGIYLEIETLANQRNIEAAKLQNGLGLWQMAMPDADEDTATFAANALYDLIIKNNINPSEIDRIYLGTESALDSSKPTISFAVNMVEEVLKNQLQERVFQNTDIVDLTFACIGGVDALQTCLDYIRANPNKKAIVISSDYAKYELDSSGEYTQGAGAVAMLIKSNPDLLVIEPEIGVSQLGVFDFFKPRRIVEKESLSLANETSSDTIEIFKDEPVFEGQYSNQCYQYRIREAYFHLKKQLNKADVLFNEWNHLIFHLPYAFHGKRIFTEIFAQENNLEETDFKGIAKSETYLNLVKNKIEPSQRASSAIGNMYTASIFMALLSCLQVAFNENKEIAGDKMGFFAYGSGSKSKVFSGEIQTNWKDKIKNLNLFEVLKNRKSITFDQYIQLHKKQLKQALYPEFSGFKLVKIENQIPHLIGARYYQFK